jgi:hypothetical protein
MDKVEIGEVDTPDPYPELIIPRPPPRRALPFPAAVGNMNPDA